MQEPITIHGAQEQAEVVGDHVESYACSCGHKIEISAGLIIKGANMEFVEEGSKEIPCPGCGGKISMEKK